MLYLLGVMVLAVFAVPIAVFFEEREGLRSGSTRALIAAGAARYEARSGRRLK